MYLGDVPIEATVYGAALLHRLLTSYPPGDLTVLEGNPWQSNPGQRLHSVRYRAFPIGNARLLNSRFHKLYASLAFFRIRPKWRCVDKLLAPFVPEAVLTVAHGLSWIAAAEYALRKEIPLHLVLHDDWPGPNLLPGFLVKSARRRFAAYYRRAASRLCISPIMAEVYKREGLTRATVLYPCADAGAEVFRDPPERLRRNGSSPVIGFGGTISNSGQARVLRRVAGVLAGCGGKLLIYGPLTRQQSRRLNLDLPNVELNGLTSSQAMVQAFRQCADALLIPVSFSVQDQRQSILSFPSKLADYTRAGLPLLIVAPEYSSPVRWAGTADPCAEIVTRESDALLRAALDRLMASARHRLDLAACALKSHENYFSHARAWEIFRASLLARHQTGPEAGLTCVATPEDAS